MSISMHIPLQICMGGRCNGALVFFFVRFQSRVCLDWATLYLEVQSKVFNHESDSDTKNTPFFPLGTRPKWTYQSFYRWSLFFSSIHHLNKVVFVAPNDLQLVAFLQDRMHGIHGLERCKWRKHWLLHHIHLILCFLFPKSKSSLWLLLELSFFFFSHFLRLLFFFGQTLLFPFEFFHFMSRLFARWFARHSREWAAEKVHQN